MKSNNSLVLALILILVAIFAGVLMADNYYMPRYKKEFSHLEKERIVVTNKLTTAKIVHENLNHVRDLIFNNMDFPGQPDTVDHETQFFTFMTTCVNDLKLKLISVRPVDPVRNDRVTTFGYDVEIEGDFFKFGELCAKLENNRRLVSIESYDVDQISETDEKGNPTEFKGIKVRMRVNTYRISGKV